MTFVQVLATASYRQTHVPAGDVLAEASTAHHVPPADQSFDWGFSPVFPVRGMPVDVTAAAAGSSGSAAAAGAGGCHDRVSSPGSGDLVETSTRYSSPAVASKVTDEVRTSPSSSFVATGVFVAAPG
ncbi:hypothetical protein [Cellulosimicrobium cellulans]|uniref:hypothetical protein n=1 Tax=Cellulosimicrobium cellulans TaxID=1710 RepID=UPI00301A2D4C